MEDTEIIDARGLLCPLPVLKLRKRIKGLKADDVVELWADDPAAIVDVPHYCQESGHQLISHEGAESHDIYRVRKID